MTTYPQLEDEHDAAFAEWDALAEQYDDIDECNQTPEGQRIGAAIDAIRNRMIAYRRTHPNWMHESH